MSNSRLSLSAITLIALLITTVAVPEAFAREGGDVYAGPTSSLKTLSDPNACDTLVGVDGQCAVVDGNNLPDPAIAVIEAQGESILNPDGCEIILLSSGDVSDNGPTLSTDMLGDTCRDDLGNPENNPQNVTTIDCATIDVTPAEDALIFFWSVEFPQFLGQPFTDWDRIQNSLAVSVSIEDMVGDPTLFQDPNFDGGFNNTLLASITEGTIAAGETVELRIADSSDDLVDSGKIVVPISCLEEPQPPLLCSNGIVDPGEECDDGNIEDGDGCSSLCLLEPQEIDKKVVGGEFLPIDSGTLLIAGMSANMGLVAPIVAGIAGASAYFIKARMCKE